MFDKTKIYSKFINTQFLCILLIPTIFVSSYVFFSYQFNNSKEALHISGLLLALLLNIVAIVYIVSFMTKSNPVGRNDASNHALMREMIKNEKRRSFENYFFNALGFQDKVYDKFKIDFNIGGDPNTLSCTDAIIGIEEDVESLKRSNASSAEIAEYLVKIDSADDIYRVVRTFSNVAKLISEKLSDDNGFTAEDRKSNYLTLINFTDFAVLRLVILASQYLGYQFIVVLKNNEEFESVMKEVGLDWNLY